MSDINRKEDLHLSGRLNPNQDESVLGSPFTDAIEACSSSSIGTNGIQGHSGSLNELLTSSFQHQHYTWKDFPMDSSSENSPNVFAVSAVPVNLFQDSFISKLNTLPAHQRNVLEDLAGKINYHINYFVLDDKSGTKLKLTCKLCRKTMHISKIEKHVEDPEHLGSLTKRYKENNKTTPTTPISRGDFECLDFDETSQSHQCTICKESLPDSSNSWTKHFQSSSHRSKVKSSKSNSYSNSAAVSSSVSRNKPEISAFMGYNKIGIATVDGPLKDKDKKTVQDLSFKLKGALNQFKLSYDNGSDKLYFYCKVCKISLLPKNVEVHVPTNEHQKNLRKNSSKATLKTDVKDKDGLSMAGKLKEKDQIIYKSLATKLKGDIIHFQPTYELDKLYFTCKLCNIKLLPKNVESHTQIQKHLKSLKHNLSKSKPNVTQKKTDNCKTNRALLPSNQIEVDYSKVLSIIAQDLNKQDKKIVEGFGEDTTKILTSFELRFEDNNRIHFICIVCRLSLFPKYVKSHLHSCSRVKNLRKNHYLINFEDSTTADIKTVKEILNQVNNRLYFFELFCEYKSNKLGFFCNVCCVTLAPMFVKDHILSSAHSENLRTNPFSLDFESLNRSNKQIVKKLTTLIKGRMKNFCFLYKTGTEELRFYCKLCQSIYYPEKVEFHFCKLLDPVAAKLSDNQDVAGKLNSKQQLSNCENRNSKTLPSKVITDNLNSKTLPPEATSNASNSKMLPPKVTFDTLNSKTSPQVTPDVLHSKKATYDPNLLSPSLLSTLTCVSFDSLTKSQKEILERLVFKSKVEMNFVDFFCGPRANEIYIKCKLCNLTLSPALLSEHARSADHLNNSELSTIFDNFVTLEEPFRYVLRKLYLSFGRILNIFTLVLGTADKSLKFKCKFCDVIVFWDILNAEWLENHLLNENHQATGTKGISNNCRELAPKQPSPSNSEPIKKTSEKSGISYALDGICASFGVSREEQTLLTESNCEQRMLTDNSSEKTNLIKPYTCRDCDCTINFKAEEFGGLGRKNREWLIVNCQQKSIKTKVSVRKHSQEKQEVSNCNASNSVTPGTSVNNVSIRNIETNVTEPSSVVSNLHDNPVKSKRGALSKFDKEALKLLIDKVGIEIKDFDFVLTTDSSQLCLKCKLCGMTMRPETVESHLNSEMHATYSELDNIMNLESFNELNRKVIRQVFNKIGCGIIDYDATLCFVCKICGANVPADSVQNHIISEEHLKHFSGSSSLDDSAQDLVDDKLILISKKTSCHKNIQPSVARHPYQSAHTLKTEYSDDSGEENEETELKTVAGISNDLSDFTKSEVTSEVISCHKNTQPLDPTSLCQSTLSLEKKYPNISNEETGVKAVEDISKDLSEEISSRKSTQPLVSSDLYQSTLSLKTEYSNVVNVENKETVEDGTNDFVYESGIVTKTCPKKSRKRVRKKACQKSTEFGAPQVNIQSTWPANESGAVVSVPVANEKSEASGSHSRSGFFVSTESLQENLFAVDKSNELLHLDFLNKAAGQHDPRSVKNVSNWCNSNDEGSDMEEYKCLPCEKPILRTNLNTHVNSQEHVLALQRNSNGEWNTNARGFNRRITEMCTGLYCHENDAEIFYTRSDCVLWFLCKACKFMAQADSYKDHLSQVHLFALQDKFQIGQISNNEIGEKMKGNCPRIGNAGFKVYEQLICMSCDDPITLESVLDHCNFLDHTYLLSVESFFSVQFINYKSLVLKVFCHCNDFVANDFELFHKTDSPKLRIYCSPCEELLSPSSLCIHVKMKKHIGNSALKIQKESDSTCSVM